MGGLKFGLALGLVIGLLNVIPYLGSILGLSVVLPLALFQTGGGLILAGICLGVFATRRVNVAGADGCLRLTDPGATNCPRRFYRIAPP